MPSPASVPDVCLVSMPYATLTTPSLALGLLKPILAADGIIATVAPANLWFAEAVGLPRYTLCASRMPTINLAGEWTFAGAAFGDDPRRAAKDAEYIRQITAAESSRVRVGSARVSSTVADDLWALRAAATDFVDETARRVLATGARIVGCTSTFEQHVASLALLRRIRELDPDVVTMLGGANCETVMGEATHRCFPWVDYVVSGEADGIIGTLCRLALDHGRDVTREQLPPGVLGPCHRAADDTASTHRPTLPRALFSKLDELPAPDFDEFFDALAVSPLQPQLRAGLPLESSRGCWWGAVHQCTFCGLNGTGMTFRSKSPDRVLADMQHLEARYDVHDFAMVDNILDMRYFTSLLPQLAEAGHTDRRIFYEIKANIAKPQVETMRRAGINWVQPGIESLHSEVLQLMDKGVQGWQNVQLLKWARENGLRVSWAILWGFPGEKDDWYDDMARWIPALEHLSPPSGALRMRYDRYSVYHEQARKRGLLLFPLGAMSYIYPVWPADLDRLAYYFTAEPQTGPLRYAEGTEAELARLPGVTAVAAAVRAWRAGHYQRQATLWAKDLAGALIVTDTRRCATREGHILRGLDRAVLLACDAAPRPGKIADIVRRDFATTATDDDVAAAVDRLVSDRLVLLIDDRLVALPLGAPPPSVPTIGEYPGGEVLAASKGAAPTAPTGPAQSAASRVDGGALVPAEAH